MQPTARPGAPYTALTQEELTRLEAPLVETDAPLAVSRTPSVHATDRGEEVGDAEVEDQFADGLAPALSTKASYGPCGAMQDMQAMTTATLDVSEDECYLSPALISAVEGMRIRRLSEDNPDAEGIGGLAVRRAPVIREERGETDSETPEETRALLSSGGKGEFEHLYRAFAAQKSFSGSDRAERGRRRFDPRISSAPPPSYLFSFYRD